MHKSKNSINIYVVIKMRYQEEKRKVKRFLSPAVIIVLSFFSLILVGTILLFLPISTVEGQHLSFIDALFMSTSAVTITGLSPVSDVSATLTVFGKIVLALLIQFGGLGVITLSVFVMIVIGAKIGITNRVLLRENLNSPSMAGVVGLIRKIVIVTFIIEFVGFLINLIVFIPLFPGEVLKAVGISAFHSISSFNNAGFDILGSSSLINYNSNVLLMLNTAFLIMAGGLGFIVIIDIIKKKSYKKLMIHSKIVIFMNLVLWIGGTFFIMLTQIGGSETSWLNAFFTAVSSRTAGFASVNMGALNHATILFVIVLMFIGGSPSSTAGGIKTTTFYTLVKSVTGYATGSEITTHKRAIGLESRQKAFLLLFIAISTVITGTALILVFDNLAIGDVLFEVTSAMSNVGFSLGITTSFSLGSKIVLVLVMFAGRVGPLTIIALTNKNWYRVGKPPISYIEERIIIG